MPLGPAVLAALAVDAGRPVQIDTLIDRVWKPAPPEQARGVLVNRLRQALRVGRDRVALARRSGGYVLDIDPLCVDLIHFDWLARGGTLEELEAALGLWRGPALADLSGEWVLQTRDVLAQRRLETTVDWARLETGRTKDVIDVLRPLVDEHPSSSRWPRCSSRRCTGRAAPPRPSTGGRPYGSTWWPSSARNPDRSCGRCTRPCSGRPPRRRIRCRPTPPRSPVVDAFPLTVTGKVRKNEMRHQSIRELGLEAAAAVATA